ncbi:hypothetical protein JQ566_27520 [Bradyrhizobium japonicum]|nr:hypothetical protein [Bradyrhizobium japonicum]MBR0961094.1 hypothetical protein [Bradyrhizobium japonicum]
MAAVVLCGFRVVFTLDDAYIHLAVADQILSGGYGINAGEYSSPSSSIVWPYILALTEAMRLGIAGPLLINVAAAGATVFTLVRLYETGSLFDGSPLSWLIVLLLVFNVSAVALPMTGMEHSLHVWATVATFAGLVVAARGSAPSPVHFIALVLLPFIRFEGAAFACAATAGFAMLGYRRFAAAAAVVMIAALAAYLALMASRGLPLLPSSVLLKGYLANLDGTTGSYPAIVQNLLRSVLSAYGLRLILLGFAVAACANWLRTDRRALIVLLTVLAAVGAHLVFGQYGWLNRYEVYIMALATAALVWGAAQFRPHVPAARWGLAKGALGVMLGMAALPYVTSAVISPVAASDIYEQQYQMARFAHAFYRRAVGVNDLGLVAYGNSDYVLDLWGLGSEPVRKARTAGEYGPAEMDALVRQHDVGVVMIYDAWFPQGVPSDWTRVAILQTRTVMLSQRNIAFYRTPLGDAAAVEAALRALGATLPPRDTLHIVAP